MVQVWRNSPADSTFRASTSLHHHLLIHKFFFFGRSIKYHDDTRGQETIFPSECWLRAFRLFL